MLDYNGRPLKAIITGVFDSSRRMGSPATDKRDFINARQKYKAGAEGDTLYTAICIGVNKHCLMQKILTKLIDCLDKPFHVLGVRFLRRWQYPLEQYLLKAPSNNQKWFCIMAVLIA